MNEDILSKVFENYIGNKAKVGEVASHVDAVVKAAMDSPFGEQIENMDGFSATPSDRQISTIRTRTADESGQSSDVIIEVFAEGRAVVTASRYDGVDMELQHREERTLYFSPEDHASGIAGRVLSAIVDINENDVAEAFQKFTRSATQEIGSHPGAER